MHRHPISALLQVNALQASGRFESFIAFPSSEFR